MRVSVVIPCLDAAPYIGSALESVARQTRPADEIIVVDDGSTDGSIEVIEAAGVADRLVRAGCRNAAAARNAGIAVASGDWIALLDADDVWYPEHLERAVALLTDSADVGYCSHADRLTPDAPPRRVVNRWPVESPTSGLTPRRYVQLFGGHPVFCTSSVVARRTALVARGVFDPRFVRRHDLEMWLRLICGATWSYDPMATCAYRTGLTGSLSRSDWASSEYWHLRALLAHRPAYDGPIFDRLIRQAARRAMSAALTDGGLDDRARASQWAVPLLSPALKALFAIARQCPGSFRALNRLRRRLLVDWQAPGERPALHPER